MKKLIYLIVAIVALSLIIAGCGIPVVPPAEQDESGTLPNKNSGDPGEVWNDTTNTSYTTIQLAIDAASAGDTINVGPGTYTENININKRLTLNGAGSSTIINPFVIGTPVVQISAFGDSATDRLTLSNIRVTGNTGTGGHGILISSVGSFITFDNVTSDFNGGKGVEAGWNGVAQDIEILNCTFSNNTSVGFRTSSTASIRGLTITDTDMNENSCGLYLNDPITGLNITGGSFDGNYGTGTSGVGIWAQQLDNFPAADRLTNVLSGFTAEGNKRGVILHTYGPFSIIDAFASNNLEEGIAFATDGEGNQVFDGSITDPILISNVTANNNPTWNLAVFSYNRWTLSNITIEDCTFNGSTGIPGYGVWLCTLHADSTLSNVTVTGSTMNNNNYGLYLRAEANGTLSGVNVTECSMNENETGVYLRALYATANLTGVSMSNNEILNNSENGILVSEDAALGNEAHRNNIVGNGYGIQNDDTTEDFDAICNWYGDICGPSGEGPGSGDAVSSEVIFLPWLIDVAPYSECGGGLPICYCEMYDETAWAYAGEDFAEPNNEVEGNKSEAWGWTNNFTENGVYAMVLYAAAGQNDSSKGFPVGTIYVYVEEGECVEVIYDIIEDTDYQITEAHLWVGDTELPLVGKKEVPTSAPGQFPYSPTIAEDGKSATWEVCGFEVPIWVAAHAVIEWKEEWCEDWVCPE